MLLELSVHGTGQVQKNVDLFWKLELVLLSIKARVMISLLCTLFLILLLTKYFAFMSELIY